MRRMPTQQYAVVPYTVTMNRHTMQTRSTMRDSYQAEGACTQERPRLLPTVLEENSWRPSQVRQCPSRHYDDGPRIDPCPGVQQALSIGKTAVPKIDADYGSRHIPKKRVCLFPATKGLKNQCCRLVPFQAARILRSLEIRTVSSTFLAAFFFLLL